MTHITNRHYFKCFASSLTASADATLRVSQCPSPVGSKPCRDWWVRQQEQKDSELQITVIGLR